MVAWGVAEVRRLDEQSSGDLWTFSSDEWECWGFEEALGSRKENGLGKSI